MRPAPTSTSAVLDSSHFSTAIHIDPKLGVLCIGWHAASGRLRAIDGATGRIGWEAPPSVVVEPAAREIVVTDGRVYVVHDMMLSALDLHTGALGWQIKLQNGVQTGFGRPCLADPYPSHAAGILVAQLVDEQFVGIDRSNGAWRWSLPDAAYFGPFAIPGGVVLSAKVEDRLHLLFMDPMQGPGFVRALLCADGQLRLAGRNVLVGASDIDGEGHPGIAVVEMPGGRLLAQCAAPYDDRRGPPVAAGAYVWSADLLEFAGSPNGPRARPEIVPGHCIDRLASTTNTLVASFNTDQGASRLRLVGFDPATLAVRWVSDRDLGARPKLGEGMSNLASLGRLVVVAGAALDERGAPDVLLNVFDGDTGRLMWFRAVPGALEEIDAAGGMIRLRTNERTWVFRADHHQPIVVFPRD